MKMSIVKYFYVYDLKCVLFLLNTDSFRLVAMNPGSWLLQDEDRLLSIIHRYRNGLPQDEDRLLCIIHRYRNGSLKMRIDYSASSTGIAMGSLKMRIDYSASSTGIAMAPSR
jgi:hypothetical protein